MTGVLIPAHDSSNAGGKGAAAICGMEGTSPYSMPGFAIVLSCINDHFVQLHLSLQMNCGAWLMSAASPDVYEHRHTCAYHLDTLCIHGSSDLVPTQRALTPQGLDGERWGGPDGSWRLGATRERGGMQRARPVLIQTQKELEAELCGELC